MKIDSQQNLSVASKHATSRKSQIESPGAGSFEDLLKGAKLKERPKAAKPDEKPEVETKKPAGSAKKTSTQKKRVDQSDECATPEETGEVNVAETEKNKPTGDQDAESDTSVETDAEAEANDEVEKPAEVAAKTDTAEISNLAQATAAAAAQMQASDAQSASVETGEQVVAVEGSTQDITTVKTTTAKPSATQIKGTADVATDASAVDANQTSSTDASITPLVDPTAEDSGVEVDQQDESKTADAKTAEQKLVADSAAKATAVVDDKSAQTLEHLQSQNAPHTQAASHQPTVKAPEAQQQPLTGSPDVRFAQDNHPQIVSGIRGELLPNGGSMTLKLDPPELGALQVQLHMRDGTMTATFQTSNDDATRMLSHSLSSLKSSLESQGINVDKLQVQQAPKDQQTGTNQDPREQSQGAFDNQSARQEQQRKEMLQRMWRKLSGVEDPLDMVA